MPHSAHAFNRTRERPRRHAARKPRLGFTLTELLASISIVSALAALILPAVLATRAAARSHTCRNNLRQMGVALHAFASKDPQRRFCSGAYDYLRDGCPDTYGWVADVVNMNAGMPQKMLCSDSPARGSEKLNDMLGVTVSAAPGEEAPLQFRETGYCRTWNSSNAGSPERINDIIRMLEDGYGTNYAASWYLVRSAARVDRMQRTTHALKGLQGTLGPLTMTRLASSEISSNVLPFLGCAAPGDTDESRATHQIPGFIEEGARLAESFTDGPAFWNGSRIEHMPAGTSIAGARPVALPTRKSPGAAGADGRIWMHDTRDWYAWHGTSKSRHCNLLMADGSVRSFSDANADGYLNPGFQVTGESMGFTSGLVEAGPHELFSGSFVEKQIAP